MKSVPPTERHEPLLLNAVDAADLMTVNPLSLREVATVREAAAFLTDHGISAAPVIDEAGKAVGVLSRSDLLVHQRHSGARVPEYYSRSDLATAKGERLGERYQVEKVDQGAIRGMMTPVVYSVSPKSPADKVVEQLVDLKVHRLFVVDSDGVLIGVISALDILRRLIPSQVDAKRG